MVDKAAVWERICRHAGSEFTTTTGLSFTYVVPGNYLRVTRDGRQINRSLSRTNFEKAMDAMPADRTVRPQGPAGLVVHLGDPDGSPDQIRRLVIGALRHQHARHRPRRDPSYSAQGPRSARYGRAVTQPGTAYLRPTETALRSWTRRPEPDLRDHSARSPLQISAVSAVIW